MAVVGLLAGVVGLNAVAFLQARSMTHDAAAGTRTGRPERLSLVDKLGILVRGVRLPRPEIRRTPADRGLSFETARDPKHFACFGATAHGSLSAEDPIRWDREVGRLLDDLATPAG